MFTTETPLAFTEKLNTSGNGSDNYENITFVNDKSDSNYFVIDEKVMDILHKILLCGIIPPIAAFGIVGNLLALLILTRRKPINSTTVVLIAIAIADLAFIVSTTVTLATLLTKIFYPEQAKEVSMKTIIPFSVYLGPLPGRISNWLVALVSLERLVAVTRPLKVKQICTKKLMIVFSIVLPLSVAILTFPKLWLYEVKDVTLPDGNVTKIITLGFIGRQKKLFEVYYLVTETLLRFVPMGVIILSNIIIIFVICIQARWRRQKQNYAMSKHPSEDKGQITRTLLTITCIFIVCLLPSTISRMMILFDPNSTHVTFSSNVHSLFNLVGLLTETTNSSINFVIYVTMNSAYRRQLYLICGKRCGDKGRSKFVSSAVNVKRDNRSTDVSATESASTEDTEVIHM